MGKRILSWLSWTPFFLLVPYLMTIWCNGVDIALDNHVPDVENCIPLLLFSQIPDTYEKETLKAQAVIARTNLYKKIEKKDALQVFQELEREWEKADIGPGTILAFLLDHGKNYEAAAEETEGQVLTYEYELPLIPYHEMSGGRTRDGAETFHDDAYAYLASVVSEADTKNPEFTKIIYLSKRMLPADLKIRDVDPNGYVTLLEADGKLLEGEAFRLGMMLPSANFTLEELKDEYRFVCKGSGHGVGFSQYGGNVLAKKGADHIEILKKYFPLLEVKTM